MEETEKFFLPKVIYHSKDLDCLNLSLSAGAAVVLGVEERLDVWASTSSMQLLVVQLQCRPETVWFERKEERRETGERRERGEKGKKEKRAINGVSLLDKPFKKRKRESISSGRRI